MAELMKGHKFRDHKAKMIYPAWAEHKLDEIRVHVKVSVVDSVYSVEFLSYAGKPLHNLSVFADKFIQLTKCTGYYEFDCGFEANGNFNDSYRWVRSSKGLPEELKDVPVIFYLFDLPELVGEMFPARASARQMVSINALADGLQMHIPVGAWVNNADEVDELFHRVVKQGIEGLMVKSLEHMYVKGTRSYGWLKVKPEDDGDGVIEELIEAVSEEGVPLGRTGSVRIRVEDGSVATPHGIAWELGADMHANPEKYIGQWAEFKFMERDRQGGYRHPRWHRIRESK